MYKLVNKHKQASSLIVTRSKILLQKDYLQVQADLKLINKPLTLRFQKIIMKANLFHL